MKVCKQCGKELPENAVFCEECGNDTREKEESGNNKNTTTNKKISLKVIISIAIAIIIGAIGIIGLLISKDKILYNNYKAKGYKEKSVSKSIDYYTNALEIKYTDEIVKGISEKITDDENFEEELTDLNGILNEKDLKNIYIKIYVKKAKENYNNENYETALKYLKKAEKYNYDIETFEYYEDLMSATDEISNNQKSNQEIYIYKNDEPVYIGEGYDYYIIPDSSNRYLTKEELYQYDEDSLGFIRNEIFARHGYIFNNENYRDYFTSMPWYLPNPSFKGTLNELNSIEKYNVELIKSME